MAGDSKMLTRSEFVSLTNGLVRVSGDNTAAAREHDAALRALVTELAHSLNWWASRTRDFQPSRNALDELREILARARAVQL